MNFTAHLCIYAVILINVKNDTSTHKYTEEFAIEQKTKKKNIRHWWINNKFYYLTLLKEILNQQTLSVEYIKTKQLFSDFSVLQRENVNQLSKF